MHSYRGARRSKGAMLVEAETAKHTGVTRRVFCTIIAVGREIQLLVMQEEQKMLTQSNKYNLDVGPHRELLRLLLPVREEAALLFVDLEIRHLEADRLVWVAREQQILQGKGQHTHTQQTYDTVRVSRIRGCGRPFFFSENHP